MKSKILGLLAAGFLIGNVVTGVANAALVSFDFDFFDANGGKIGDGIYQFDEINHDTAYFSVLTNLSWSFTISGLGTISSATGDKAGAGFESIEGVLLSGAVGSRTLQFFDDTTGSILHGKDPNIDPGVYFLSRSQTVQYQPSGLLGSFTARELNAVPEPGTLALLGLGLAGLGLSRRRKAN